MRLLLALAAVVMVGYGVLTASPPWVIAGALAIAVLASGRFGAVSEEDGRHFNQLVKRGLGPPWRQLLLGSLLCAAIAGWISRQNEFAMSSLYVWLLALVLALGAGLVHDRWYSGAAAQTGRQPYWTRLDLLLVASLAALALVLRLYQLGEYLPPVHGDEGEMGLLALLARYGAVSGISEQPLPPFSIGFLDHPTLFQYVQAVALALFGDTITALRSLSAVVGALCAPLIYAIGRLGWGRVAGFTAGWLLAVSHLHIHYSRIALNNIETVWFVTLLIGLLSLAYATNQPRRGGGEPEPDPAGPPARRAPALTLFVAMGLVIGLGQYFYYGSRLLPVLAVILLFALWLQHRLYLRQVAVLIVATLVAYLPLALFYSNNLVPFLNRMRGVSIFNPEGLAHTLGPQAVWPNDLPLLLWEQIKSNLFFFLHYGDESTFYLAAIPAFDKVTVILFWLGLGLVIANVRRFHELALIVWLGVGVFLAGVITRDAPNGPRLIVAVPAMYLVSGVFVQKLVDFLARVWPQHSRAIGLGTVGALAAVTLVLNFNIYFVDYNQRQPNTVTVEIAREMVAAGDEYRTYLMGAPNLYVNYGTIRFIAFAAEKHDLASPGQLQPLLAEAPAGKGVLLIALPHRVAELAQIEQQFPNGTHAEHQDARGNLLYVTYRIPPEAVAQRLAGDAH